MKKILAIVLALSMALSLSTAFASGTPAYQEATVTIHVDSQIIQMLAGGGDPTLDAVFSILNKMSIVLLEGENDAAEIAVNLPEGKLVTLNGMMTEQGYLITTDLLPSFAILADNATIAEVLSSMTAAIPADGGAQMPDFTAITEIVKPYMSEPEIGAFAVNGKNYVTKVNVSMDGVALMQVLRAVIAMLPADSAADLPALPSDEEAAAENMLLQFDSYYTEDMKGIAMEFLISEEGTAEQRMLFEAALEDAGTANLALYIPANIEFESWEAAIAALNAGEDMGYSLTGSLAIDNPEEMKALKIDVALMNGGQYMFGLKLDVQEAGMDLALTVMSPEVSLFTANIAIGLSDTPAPAVDAGERAVIDVKTLEGISEDSELYEKIMTDLQYVVGILMGQLIQLAPEEMTVLLKAGTEQTEETTTEEIMTEEIPTEEIPAA